MNKKKIIIIVIMIVLVIAIIIPLSLTRRRETPYIDDIEKVLLKEFSELNLRKLEKEEVSGYFGIYEDKNEDMLFLTDFNDDSKPFSPNVLIVIINSNDYDDILSNLKTYINVEIDNSTDMDRVKLYQERVIKAKKDYCYLVIGDDKNIIKVLDQYYE